MAVITSIADLRKLAERRLPRALFDYLDRGSYTEATLQANREQLAAINFRQRVGVNVANRNLKTTMLGQEVTLPLAIAPTGLTGLNWPAGEISGALAAEKFGVPFTLSTLSICSMEEVSKAVTKPFWFQLYVMRDRGFMRELIARAKQAKVSALMLTLDLQIMGQRHRDLKNGLSIPPRITLANSLNMLSKLPWLWQMQRCKYKTFGNLDGHVRDRTGINSVSEWIATQFDPTLNWDDVAWVKQEWGGPLILKGILDPYDAKLALKTGANALVVSNHGGRQLDGAIASICALPEISTLVGDQVEIWLDGGIQSGQDVLRALAVGASAVLIGKAWLYGLAAAGEAGVRRALEIIAKELDVTMALTGNCDVRQLNDCIYPQNSGHK